MTPTATHIPATGYRAELADGTVITALYLSGAGYKLQARRNGQLIASQLHTFETDALRVIAALIAEHTPATPEPAPAAAIPGNIGTTIRVSDPAHTILAVAAMAHDGIVEQGGKPGQATRTQLRSLAKKGYLELIYETRTDARLVPIGGRITAQGRRRLAELTAADRENAERAARAAAIQSIAA